MAKNNNLSNGKKSNGTNGSATISMRNWETSMDKAFYMSNGTVITKLGDLPSILESTDDQTFSYHVNSEKNDFANWIRDVFNVSPLANKISKKRSKDELVRVLRSEIK